MKKIITLSFFLLIAAFTFAKKVKFAVDMRDQVISPNGVHVTGDFQTLAGFPGGDWSSSSTVLTQEGSTSIYSIIVNIPAFQKYEYKFVNGDQFYEVEFVPVESRVGYNFNDNRWLYLDSLKNDTTFVGAIMFGGNAPYGKKLTRFYVDMKNETVSSKGVHVAGTFQGFDPAATILYKFQGTVYEIIQYVDSTSTYQYKFYNGNTGANAETVPGICATNNNRTFSAPKDTLLAEFCFSSCSNCLTTDATYASDDFTLKLYPNPTSESSQLELSGNIHYKSVYVYNINGSPVYKWDNIASAKITLNKNHIESGVYFITVSDIRNRKQTVKWVVQ